MEKKEERSLCMEKKENMKKRYTISLLICVVIVTSLVIGYIL